MWAHILGVQRSSPATSALFCHRVSHWVWSLLIWLDLSTGKARGGPDSDSLHWDCRCAAVFNSFYLRQGWLHRTHWIWIYKKCLSLLSTRPNRRPEPSHLAFFFKMWVLESESLHDSIHCPLTHLPIPHFVTNKIFYKLKCLLFLVWNQRMKRQASPRSEAFREMHR